MLLLLFNHLVKMKKREQNKDTEAKILAAAKKVFVIKGMAGARMQDIADEMGMNKALLHYYFKNKEQLFEVIFKDITTGFIPRIKALLIADIPLQQKIENFCENYIQMAIENPFLPLFVLNEMNKQPVAFVQRVFGGEMPNLNKFTQQLEDEINAKRIKPTSPVHLIMNMMSMCIFPFIGKPMIGAVLGLDELQFRLAMEQRKKEIPKFIFDSITK